MEWDADQLADLIIKYYTEQADAQERVTVEEFMALPGNRERVAEMFSKEGFEKEKAFWDLAERRTEASRQAILAAIEEYNSTSNVRPLRKGFRSAILAAASIILVLFSAYIVTHLTHRNASPLPSIAGVDLPAGGQHATLTLSTGKRLVLDDVPNGQVANEAGSIVQKPSIGHLDYINQNTKTNPEIAFNTLATPRGGTYQVLLPDHSIAILNSESSLTYPTAFPSKGPRTVQLTGEAYFDVHHDAKHPFQVQVAHGTIEALGTSFNVNAYGDEQAVRATLLDGLIRVVGESQSTTLHPGQQAVMKTDRLTVLSGVDTDAVVGWKNGDFVFNS